MDYTNLDFFGYNKDQRNLLHLLALAAHEPKKHKLCLMVAPSFVVDFDYKNFVPLMKGLGFGKVTELTFGAKIVNEHYHKFIREHYSDFARGKKIKGKKFQKMFISSVCPSSVELVKNRHPELKKFLLPFDSPMGATAKILKKEFPSHKIIFLSPCSAKKFEAAKLLDKKGRRIIELAVTFAEMKQIVAKEKPVKAKASRKFDSFYNDYTKVYPLAGGLADTLHYKGILHKSEVVSMDGVADLEQLFSSHPDKVFYDVLFCRGGCIGGPGVASHAPLFARKQRVIAYRDNSKREKMDGRQGLDKYTKGIAFSREL